MDDPIADITPIIHTLTQSSPSEQRAAITEYFTSDASFTHPFCRTGSYKGSRNAIISIFQWYKILSPKIDLEVKSIAYDETNLILYVTISQIFAIWFIPFYSAPVTLTTVLQLTRLPPNSSYGGKYYITSQNDLYQVDQFVKFFAPWGGSSLILLWHFIATFVCIILAYLGTPFTRYMQSQADREQSQLEKNQVEEDGNGIDVPADIQKALDKAKERLANGTDGKDERDIQKALDKAKERLANGADRVEIVSGAERVEIENVRKR